MKPVDECIRVIAAGLGWEFPFTLTGQTLRMVEPGLFGGSVVSTLDLFAFIATAEAELAKRVVRIGPRACGSGKVLMVVENHPKCHHAEPFDPTDPISTAHAKLRAMAEAVEMMKGDEG